MTIRPVIAFACLTLAVSACDQHADTPPAPEPRPVISEVLTYRDPAPLSRLVGEIRPHYESDLGFKIGGRLVDRPVELGILVRKGQILARLDLRDERNQDLAARADVTAAQAGLTQAAAEEQRQITLHASGWAAQAKLDSARQARENAQAALAAAKARRRLAADRIDDTVLRAPEDGTITETLAEAGQVVAAGQTVLRLARLDRKDAVFSVAERWATGLHAGDTVSVAGMDGAGPVVNGRVADIAPAADATTRTVLVKVALDDAAPLRLGQPVTGRFAAGTRRLAALPAAALSQLDGQPALWVVDAANGTVTPVKVVLDHVETDRILILDGPPEGSRVVTAGVQLLRPGQKVRADGEARP